MVELGQCHLDALLHRVYTPLIAPLLQLVCVCVCVCVCARVRVFEEENVFLVCGEVCL